MVALVKIVAQYSMWLYAALAVIALLSLRMIQLAQKDIRQSLFSLEREAARARFYRSLALLISMLILTALVFAFGRYVSPLVAEPTPVGPTATSLLAPTPTPGPLEITPTPTATSTIAVPTRRPTLLVPTLAVATATRFAPTAAAPLCPNVRARITSPGEGARLSGAVQVSGSAAVEGFSFYKIEVGIGSRPQNWSVMGDIRRTQITDGPLGIVDTNALPPGEYTLRLVVVDGTGNFPDPCEVRVTIVR